MPLILDHNQVLDIYAECRERKWVLPAFNAENLTTMEAILAAVFDYGNYVNIQDLPIIIGITNTYKDRPQSVYYTQTRRWQTGLRLFLADLGVLTSADSPYSGLRVMIHLDHIIWDEDKDLLEWDMNQFSSIMYDASTVPFEQNIQLTSEFVEKHGRDIIIEGACDVTSKAGQSEHSRLTTPEMAEYYIRQTGVDIIVPNLGTEHRAAASTLIYRDDLARKISRLTGPRLCLHGTSSVSKDKVSSLFDDGICKVNIWTALERDSSYELLLDMLKNASRIVGPEKAGELLSNELIGKMADNDSALSIDYYTITHRHNIVFHRMKDIIAGYLKFWYI